MALLRQLTGKPEAACRTQIGRWRKILGDDDALLLGLLIEVQTVNPADPVPWLEKAIALRTGRAKPEPRQSNLAWMADELRAEASRDNAMPTIDGEAVH